MGGRTRTGATRLGDAGASLVHPHPDDVLLLARLDDLEVDLRNLRAERGEVDHCDVVDTDDAVRVPEAQVSDGTIGVTPERVPVGRLIDRLDRPHVDRGLDRVGRTRSSEADQPFAGVGQDALVVEVTTPHRERLREAADAVPAHLGPAPIGVVQPHSRRIPGFGLAHEQTVGADAAATIAQPTGDLRQTDHGDIGVEHDEEVVAEPLVLGQCEGCHVCFQRTDRSGRGTTPRPGTRAPVTALASRHGIPPHLDGRRRRVARHGLRSRRRRP